MKKPTKAQRRIIDEALAHPLGLVERYQSSGLQRASWHAMMSRLVADGWFTPYRHGGYEITDVGRGLSLDTPITVEVTGSLEALQRIQDALRQQGFKSTITNSEDTDGPE